MTDKGPAMAAPMPTPRPIARHYGMDWLRIGAFALLILYHIGMVFVPWNFHIKSHRVEDWVALPMLALNAWRLGLLFVVSGYASRALLSRSSGAIAFTRNRTARLLVPLIFGIIAIVPVQPWIELVVKRGYPHDFGYFWLHDYFRFGKLAGLDLPTWNHLWFVAYLWVYTLVLALLLTIVPGKPAQRMFDRLFGGWGVLLIPLAWALAVHVWLLPFRGETHALFDDSIAHAIYLPAFLFGFGLAGSEGTMRAIRRVWPWAAGLAVIGYAAKLAAELSWPGNTPVPAVFIPWYGAAHAMQQWGAIVALIGIAERFFNHDHRLRPMLTEAVFPFYIIHQTIIVLTMWLILPLALPGWGEFTILLAATVTGCWAFYLAGREVPWLRPLIGLRLTKRAQPARQQVPA